MIQAAAEQEVAVEITISTVRSRGRRGGVIVSGRTAEDRLYVARCCWTLIPDSSFPDPGQVWAMRGVLGINQQRELQIEATHAEMVRPSGKNIVAWIAGSSACRGIGTVKAQRLFDRFGPGLVDLIAQRDVDALASFVSIEAAELVCHAFDKYRIGESLLWLDQIGIPRTLGQKIVDCYEDKARAKVEANPYALLAFEAQWNKVDGLARERFGVPEEDPRRLEAAVEEALYRGLGDGHTCLPTKDVKNRLKTLLHDARLVDQALTIGESTQYLRIDDLYQPAGMYIMEHEIAERLVEMVVDDPPEQRSLFAHTTPDREAIEVAVERYERATGGRLSAEQRQAVLCSTQAVLSLILGGAGTGKTTVLRAVYAVLEATQEGMPIHQIALAGRAAQRMEEATGRPASTIASFLARVDRDQLGPGTVVVVDEMSMVDTILFYRLLRHIPRGTHLVLVGDPSQLPPIGPGLVLHALAGHPAIPQTELTVTHRQSAASGIPCVAAAVRMHSIPKFAEYAGRGSGVAFVECPETALDETVQRLYRDLGGDGEDYNVQILSATRNGLGSVRHLNQALHEQYRGKAEPVYCHDPQHGVVPAATIERVPLRVGDLVIYTRNDYQLGLRNGSMGRITRALALADAESVCCAAVFDDEEYTLKTEHIHALSHAYAITIHKSQGSQFARVIVPIRKARNLDQALLYTAITRGVDQVVLVGDKSVAMATILTPASAAKRHATLARLLSTLSAKNNACL